MRLQEGADPSNEGTGPAFEDVDLLVGLLVDE